MSDNEPTDVLAEMNRLAAEAIHSCAICGRKPAERHHKQYLPTQIIVYLCSRCHRKVHRTDGWHDELKPERDRKSLPVKITAKLNREADAGNAVFIEDIDELDV